MLVVCGACKTVNRVNPERAEQPVCGKCKAALDPRTPGFPVEGTDSNFELEVVRAGVPVLVDFWSDSCPPCRRLEPHLKELARELAGKLKVVKISVDNNRALPGAFGIRAVPTLILYRGKEIARTSGYLSLPELRTFVKQA